MWLYTLLRFGLFFALWGIAYLVGVRNFSTPALRVLSARIMGIESDHRTLARYGYDDPDGKKH